MYPVATPSSPALSRRALPPHLDSKSISKDIADVEQAEASTAPGMPDVVPDSVTATASSEPDSSQAPLTASGNASPACIRPATSPLRPVSSDNTVARSSPLATAPSCPTVWTRLTRGSTPPAGAKQALSGARSLGPRSASAVPSTSSVSSPASRDTDDEHDVDALLEGIDRVRIDDLWSTPRSGRNSLSGPNDAQAIELEGAGVTEKSSATAGIAGDAASEHANQRTDCVMSTPPQNGAGLQKSGASILLHPSDSQGSRKEPSGSEGSRGVDRLGEVPSAAVLVESAEHIRAGVFAPPSKHGGIPAVATRTRSMSALGASPRTRAATAAAAASVLAARTERARVAAAAAAAVAPGTSMGFDAAVDSKKSGQNASRVDADMQSQEAKQYEQERMLHLRQVQQMQVLQNVSSGKPRLGSTAVHHVTWNANNIADCRKPAGGANGKDHNSAAPSAQHGKSRVTGTTGVDSVAGSSCSGGSSVTTSPHDIYLPPMVPTNLLGMPLPIAVADAASSKLSDSINKSDFPETFKVFPCPHPDVCGAAEKESECFYFHAHGLDRRRANCMQYKPHMCRFIEEAGGCRKGDRCPFSHNDFERRYHPDRFGKETCRDFLRGDCPRRYCTFRHEVSDKVETAISQIDAMNDKEMLQLVLKISESRGRALNEKLLRRFGHGKKHSGWRLEGFNPSGREDQKVKYVAARVDALKKVLRSHGEKKWATSLKTSSLRDMMSGVRKVAEEVRERHRDDQMRSEAGPDMQRLIRAVFSSTNWSCHSQEGDNPFLVTPENQNEAVTALEKLVELVLALTTSQSRTFGAAHPDNLASAPMASPQPRHLASAAMPSVPRSSTSNLGSSVASQFASYDVMSARYDNVDRGEHGRGDHSGVELSISGPEHWPAVPRRGSCMPSSKGAEARSYGFRSSPLTRTTSAFVPRGVNAAWQGSS